MLLCRLIGLYTQISVKWSRDVYKQVELGISGGRKEHRGH